MEKDVNSPMDMHATTILAIKKNGHVAMAGDGQVTLGQTMIMKHTARKIRRVGDGNILAGFAGNIPAGNPAGSPASTEGHAF